MPFIQLAVEEQRLGANYQNTHHVKTHVPKSRVCRIIAHDDREPRSADSFKSRASLATGLFIFLIFSPPKSDSLTWR